MVVVVGMVMMMVMQESEIAGVRGIHLVALVDTFVDVSEQILHSRPELGGPGMASSEGEGEGVHGIQ